MSMRYISSIAWALLGAITSLPAGAVDVRGQVMASVMNGNRSVNLPKPGFPVALAIRNQNGLVTIRQTTTNASGLYFFHGIAAGNYFVLAESNQYPVTIDTQNVQDLPPLVVP